MSTVIGIYVSICIVATGVAQQVGPGAGDVPAGVVTEPPVQRGAARVLYGSGPVRGAPPPPTVPSIRIHDPPPAHLPPLAGTIEHQYPPNYEILARSGVRLPNGGIAPYGVGAGHPGAISNGWMGGRSGDVYSGRSDHIIIPGVGRNLNPGINPNHRQDHLSYGMPSGRGNIVHGVMIQNPLDGRGSRVIQGDEDDFGEDGLGNGDDDCRPACLLGEFECTSSCTCIKMDHRCDGVKDCLKGEDEADCRPSPARAPCLESAGRLRCPQSPLCISKDWLCDGDDDCGDFSDETHCGGSVKCSVDQFECNNGLCVHRSWLCDDDNDCKDNSDELNCTKIECTENEFQCADGKCITLTWRCDHESDCEDGSDELHCSVDMPMCNENEFACVNKKCVRKSFQCDGYNDCEDWSDEDRCPMIIEKCSTGEFRCNDGKCLPQLWRCDMQKDCEGGEDEENCGPSNHRTCTPDEHTCSDGKCILKTWVCDGTPDCSKGDDEINCEVSCEIGQFMCKAYSNNSLSSAFRACVNRKHVCDGQKDCPLGDDEDNCSQKRDCEPDTKCEHNCITTATNQPACSCKPGYVLAEDGYSCKDIDECMYEQDPVCSQTCSNTIGTFTCGCMTGYILRPDLRTCKAYGASPTLLFTNRVEVRQVSLNSEKYTSILKGLHNAVALDYHYEKKLIFWAEVMLDSIRVANVNGSNITDVIKWGLNSPAGVSVDWVHNLLFWTDSGTRRVEVATLDGKQRAVIAACDLDKPRAIAVHPGDAIVFWTDWGPNPKIERSDMDGTNRKSIVTDSIYWPNGLTLDYTASRVYWADAKHHVIESILFDGSDRKKLVSKGLPHPYAITLFEDAIFWTDWHTKSISTVNKKTGVGFQIIHSRLSYPMDIHSFHPQRQPPYNSHCGNNNGGCSHLCLPNSISYSCHCPLGITLGSDRRTCEDTVEKLLLFARKREIKIKHMENKKQEKTIDMVIPLNGVKSAFSLAWDRQTNSIFWTDVEKYTINRAYLNGSHQSIIVNTNLLNPTGLAFDWITNKLYWVDEGTRRIEVCNVDGSMRGVLVWDQLDKPRDIVLDPISGLMFWSDWGKLPSITSAYMDGTMRKKIINTNIIIPGGLALDYARGRIYWLDSGTRQIEHSKFDGTDRRVLIDENILQPVGLDIFGDEIFWTDLQTKSIHSANKITGKENKTLLSDTLLLNDVQIYHKERRTAVNRCGKRNGGCSHLCLLKPNGFSCKCPIGIKLGDDQKNCASGPKNYIIFAHRFDIRQISLDMPYMIDVVLPFPPLRHALTVDVDRKTGIIYWSDTGEDKIYKATPDGKSISTVITNGLETADGIVIDSTGRKIYWTDSGRNSIEVAELDGSNQKLLIWSGLDSPRAITLHYHHGIMFWSDWGKNAFIERADMDGQNRKIVISRELTWPNGLAIDRPAGRLYWSDAKLGTIESSDLNGKDRRNVLKGVPYPYGVVVVGLHVYWTDWKTQALHRADKINGTERTVIRGDLEGLMDVRSIQADNIVENACGKDNGGCSHLCLRSPKGFTCACPTGTLFMNQTGESDNSTTVSTTQCHPHPSNYIIFATKTKLARISLDTPELWDITLPVTNIQGAIAIDFSWEKKLIFYTDVTANIIRSVNMLNNSDTKTIISEGLETTNGLGVDWIANNIYWTDNENKVLEVARLDGSCRKKLIYEKLDEPRSLTVFPRKGYVYWTDWGESPRIERAMLDGTARKIIINRDLGFPNGLAIDYKAKRLYWADALKDRIETADLHGGNRVQLVLDASHPFGLTQFGDHIYWTSWSNKAVMRAHKTTGKDAVPIKTYMEIVMEIKVVTESRQKGWNPCRENNGGCSHLCLFGGENYTCACPDIPDDRICFTVPAKWVPMTRPGSDVAPDEYDQEKEYDDRFIVAEVFNQTKPTQKKEMGLPMSIVIITMLGAVLILIVIVVVSFIIIHNKQQTDKKEYTSSRKRVISFPNPNYNCNNEGRGMPMSNTDRRRNNRFQIFKYDRSQERVTNVYSAEGTSLIPGPTNGTHTPSSSHCTVTPDSHPSPQHDGFDSITLNPTG